MARGNLATSMNSEATQVRLPQYFIPVYYDIDSNCKRSEKISDEYRATSVGETID